MQKNTNNFEEMHHSVLELFFLLLLDSLIICMTNYHTGQPKTNSELPEIWKIGYSHSCRAVIVLHLLFGFCCVIKIVLKTDAAASVWGRIWLCKFSHSILLFIWDHQYKGNGVTSTNLYLERCLKRNKYVS